MLKHSKTLNTIVLIILLKNIKNFGTYATKEVMNVGTSYNEQGHHLAKRMDLETCLGQFDVHKNTIIRTGESQAIGGKYIQGLELDTIEECQRLCCETESCDVYIFESKKDGYCYLFECGTPENFHCKFTRHANYTSAVLTPVVKHPVEMTTPHPIVSHKVATGISQQEWELSNLKIKPDMNEKTQNLGPLAATFASSISEVTLNGNGIKKSQSAESPKVNSSLQCGRFQFACHSGECIAVYNACDGIPQCEDGSDEGPECPGEISNNVKSSSSSSDIGINKPSTILSSTNTLPQYQPTLMQQSAQQQLQSMQQQQQQQQRTIQNQIPISSVPVVNNREDPNVWESRKLAAAASPIKVLGGGGNPESQPVPAQVDSFTAYVNNRNAVQQLPSATYNSGVNNDLISNSNGGSTIEQSGLYILHQPVQDPNNLYNQQHQQHILLPPPPPPPPAPVNSDWQQQAIMNQQKLQQQQQQQQQQNLQISQQQQQQQQPVLTLPQGSVTYNMANDISSQQRQMTNIVMQQQPAQQQQMVPSLTQQQQQQSQFPSAVDVKPGTGIGAGTINNPGHMDNIAKIEDSEEYEDSEEKSTEPPKKHKHKKLKNKSKDTQKTLNENNPADQVQQLQQVQAATKSEVATQVKAAVSPVHEQYEIIHQNMALEFRDHDGQSERPGGAVLSLTLGLLITAALAILIGCRMRTVGRRARRMGGKTPYSHEADFLVNGMYL